MTKREITEAQPMSHTCFDGTRVEISIAGPERLSTLWINGKSVATVRPAGHAGLRLTARAICQIHNA